MKSSATICLLLLGLVAVSDCWLVDDIANKLKDAFNQAENELTDVVDQISDAFPKEKALKVLQGFLNSKSTEKGCITICTKGANAVKIFGDYAKYAPQVCPALCKAAIAALKKLAHSG